MIDPSVRLRRAILLGDLDLVSRIVESYPKVLRNPDFNDKANTSLHLAAIHGHVTIAHYLIKAGHEDADISWNSDHETPLMLAARHSNIEVATLLAEAFPHCVILTNKKGRDALAISCQNQKSTGLITVLLSAPTAASPTSRDHDGNTPLHHASAAGSLQALRLLLAAGADPLARNNDEWTPLAYSQTVAAEVYFKNLVAEFERNRIKNAKLDEEREKQRMAGLRIIEDDLQSDQIGIAA